MSTRAYNELVGFLLSEEDREKFEWAVGCMLDNGPCHVVVIRGAGGTGKTTLTTIARKILLSPFTGNFAPRVAFLTWAAHDIPHVDSDTFVFVEANEWDAVSDDSIVLKTTGARVPVNKHYVLMHEIDTELVDIADHCIALYRDLGDGYYQTIR
jgi:molybdopterin-guanine dinucleotide biosynthesis protein